MTSENPNSWNEWGQLVRFRLDSLDENVEKLQASVQKNRQEVQKELSEKIDTIGQELASFRLEVAKDITTLKVKAAIWGAGVSVVMGGIVSLTVSLLKG